MSHPRPPAASMVVVQRRTKIALLSVAGALVFVGGWVMVRALPEPAKNVATSSEASGSQLFTDLFTTAFRSDEGKGNFAFSIVYYFPALQTALEQFTQPSEHQREVLALLHGANANTDTIPFYVMIDSVVPQTTLDFSGAVLLDDQNQAYPFRKLEKLTTLLPQQAGQLRSASIMLFDSTSADGKKFVFTEAKNLTLTLPTIEEMPRVFSWSTRVLPL